MRIRREEGIGLDVECGKDRGEQTSLFNCIRVMTRSSNSGISTYVDQESVDFAGPFADHLVSVALNYPSTLLPIFRLTLMARWVGPILWAILHNEIITQEIGQVINYNTYRAC